MRPTGKLGLELEGAFGEVSQRRLAAEDTKLHKGKSVCGDLCVPLCPLWFMPLLLAHSYPGLHFAGGTEQADACPFKFEISVLQRVIMFVGLIAGIVQVMQSRAS